MSWATDREKRLAYHYRAYYLANRENIPLSRGGSNYIDNIVPSCQSCNSKKGTKTAEEFLMGGVSK